MRRATPSPCGFHAPRLATASGQEVATTLPIATIIWWYEYCYLRLGTFNDGKSNVGDVVTSIYSIYSYRYMYLNRIQSTKRVSAFEPIYSAPTANKNSHVLPESRKTRSLRARESSKYSGEDVSRNFRTVNRRSLVSPSPIPKSKSPS